MLESGICEGEERRDELNISDRQCAVTFALPPTSPVDAKLSCSCRQQ